MSGLTLPVAAWLLTYLVHSTLLFGSVWLLKRYVVRRESLRETLWKTALVGGLVTATVAMVAPRPGGFRVELAALSSSAQVGTPARQAPGTPSDRVSEGALDGLSESEMDGALEEGPAGRGMPAIEARLGEETAPGLESGSRPVSGPDDGAGPVDAPAAVGGGLTGLVPWVVALWLLVALALLARVVYRHTRLRLLLRDREQVPGTVEAASVLTELRRSAGVWTPVRLTSTPSVATPLALGRVEICLPARFLDELDPAEQRAALAHELAHLTRLDPIWQVVGSVIGAVFFFQPLNHVARREIRAAAEYMADGWAVRHTGAQVELARCLASVAGWVAPSAEPALAGTVAMAEGGSPLLVRVQRLLEHEPEQTTSPALRVGVAAAVLVVAAGFGPVVGEAAGPASGGTPDSRPSGGPAAMDTPRSVLGDTLEMSRDTARMGPDGPVFVPDTAELSNTNTDANSSANTNTDSNSSSNSDTDDGQGAGPSKPAQQPLTVRRLDGPGLDADGLAGRLAAAGRSAGGAPYWVAYGIEGGDSEELVTDSYPWSTRELNGDPLARRLGVTRELRAALKEPVVVLVRMVPDGAGSEARVDRITVRRPSLGMRIDGTVYWLGYPSTLESYTWFRGLYWTVGDIDVREAVVAVLGIHPVPEAATFLSRVLGSRDADRVRREAAEGLARQRPDTATARLLYDLALTDADGGVRHQAAESLARVEPGLAVELLTRLARLSDDPDVQQQAAESLARAGIGADKLLRMAMTDDDPDLRREAVELIGDRLPAAQAVPLLRRVAFESGDQTAEAQAAETLGDIGTEAAFRVLVAILEQNPGEEASFQAVEALADNFPRDMTLPVLRDVLRNHPSSRVRREALDQLDDLGG